MFKGCMVAIVTPMNEDGSIDKRSLSELVEWHIAAKTDAIVVAGSTGESATLEPDEQIDLISTIVKQVAGRIPVIAGAGTNATRSTLKLAENAKRAGADACLIVTPYYNRPTQNGLYEHYKTVVQTIAIPTIIYNVPVRTGCDILPETVGRLALLKHIIGIKEATGKIERVQEIKQLCGNDFDIYSGDDATALDLMLHGGQGIISVTANVTPKKMHDLCEAALNNDHELAHKINDELKLLHKNLFLESNPIPTKWALETMGKIKGGIRMPLLPLDKKYHQEVKRAMQNAGVN